MMPGHPMSSDRKMSIAQRKLSSVSNKQMVRVLLVEPMTTQQRLAQSLVTAEGIYEVQASSEDMLERHARGASSEPDSFNKSGCCLCVCVCALDSRYQQILLPCITTRLRSQWWA